MKLFYITLLSLLSFLCACKTNSKSNQIRQSDTHKASVVLQKVSIDDTLHHLVGTIGENIPIVMNIFIHGNNVKGSMYYKKVGHYIYLKGTVDDYGRMDLTGYLRNGQISDRFSGIYNNEVYKGKWTNKDKSKEFNFNLQRTDTEWVLIDSFKYKILDSVFVDSMWYYYKNVEVIHYPKAFPIPEAGYKIYKNLMDKILGDTPNFKALIDSMKKDRLQWRHDVQEIEYGQRFPYSAEYNQEVTVTYTKHLILTVSDYDYMYEGGAHGLMETHKYHYDMYTGKELKLSDIFAVPKSVIIKKLVIPGLDKYFQEIGQESVEEAVFDVNNLSLPDEFYFFDDGMGFYYQPYSIAAFSYGMPGFEVSYDSLKPYLSEFIKKRLGLH